MVPGILLPVLNVISELRLSDVYILSRCITTTYSYLTLQVNVNVFQSSQVKSFTYDICLSLG